MGNWSESPRYLFNDYRGVRRGFAKRHKWFIQVRMEGRFHYI